MSDPTEPVSESLNTSNVVGINEKKRGRPPKGEKASKESQNESESSEKTPKLTPGQIEHDLVSFLDRRPITERTPFPLNQVPPFPKDFRVFRIKRSDDVCIVEVIENTAYRTLKENIAADLASHLGPMAGVCEPYSIGVNKAESVVKAWSYKSRDLIKLPPPWGFKSHEHLCFNRLPYDPISTGFDDLDRLAPTFAGMLARMENYDAFCARIGSLFFPSASRKQVVWCHGDSNAGKSQVSILLEGMLGNSVAYFRQEDFEDNYWAADLVDKRAAFIKEPSSSFLRTKEFLALTGDSQTRINQKYERHYNADLNTILFCASNDKPEIPNSKEFINRVIPCEMAVIPKNLMLDENTVRTRFFKEIPYIVGYCMMVYEKLCPKHTAIEFDVEKHLQPSIDSFEGEFIDIIESRFKLGKSLFITSADLKQILFDAGLIQEKQRRTFKKFLEGRYGITEIIKFEDGMTYRRWYGMAKKYN